MKAPAITATTFIKVLHSGRTRPCLMLCEDANGRTHEVVVKLRTGKECSPAGLIRELVASLFARDLGLPAPDPYLVKIDPDFRKGIADKDTAERFRSSAGVNFGCRHMGAAYVSWPQMRSIPLSLHQDAAEIFAFDIIIQNPDRRKDKPNILRKGDDLVIFDHEMAFSFLYAITPDEYPWEGKGMEFATEHIFYDGLKGAPVSWDRLQGAMESVDSDRLDGYTNSVPEQWRADTGNTLERIQEYLDLATKNSKALFRNLTEALT